CLQRSTSTGHGSRRPGRCPIGSPPTEAAMAEKATVRRGRKANGIGHNGNAGEGAPREVFERWYRKVVEQKAAVDRAPKALKSRKTELSNTYKAAKAEHVNIDMLKSAIKKNESDHLQVLIDARDEARYLQWMGSPLGTQMQLFPEPGQLSDVAQAMMAGRSA